MTTIVGMSAAGRLTLPVDARRQLGIAHGEAQLQLEISEGKVILQPIIIVAQEDAWAYRPEFRQQLKEALDDVRAGRVHRLSESDLERIADKADRAANTDDSQHGVP